MQLVINYLNFYELKTQFLLCKHYLFFKKKSINIIVLHEYFLNNRFKVLTNKFRNSNNNNSIKL